MSKGKVLITGGAGFIGKNTANALAGERYEVIVIDNLALGTRAGLSHAVRFIQGDVRNRADLNQAGATDFVIHLAASSSSPMFTADLSGSYGNNVLGHISVLEYARHNRVKKVMFASTSSVYGSVPGSLSEAQPLRIPNFYAASKHAQEVVSATYSAQYGLEILAFRFMSVYGPHEEHKGKFANLVSQFIWGMEEGKRPVIYGDGSQTRDFTNVADIIRAFKLALETEKRFDFTVFNVGVAKATAVRDLVPIINEELGTSIQAEFIPNPIASGYIEAQLGDISKISRELGFKPTVSLEEGIADIIAKRKTNPIPPASLSF